MSSRNTTAGLNNKKNSRRGYNMSNFEENIGMEIEDAENTHAGPTKRGEEQMRKGGNNGKSSIQKQKASEMVDEDDVGDREYEEINLDDENAKNRLKNANSDKMSDIIIHLINKNKVNAKNAFEVPLPDVRHLSDFHRSGEDAAWKKLSSTLEAITKIYGFRVDSAHTEAYKVLGGLTRSEVSQSNEAGGKNKEGRNETEGGSLTEEGLNGRRETKDTGGEKTLEKNLANINSTKYDMEFDIDPLFQKTSAKFDETGAKGLLLNNLFVASDMSLLFDSSAALHDSLEGRITNRASDINRGAFVYSKPFEIGLERNDAHKLNDLKISPELTDYKVAFLKSATDFVDATVILDRTTLFAPRPQEHSLILLDNNDDVPQGPEPMEAEGDVIEDLKKAVAFDDNNEDDELLMGDAPPNVFWNLDQNDPPQINVHPEHDGKDINITKIEEKLAKIGLGKPLDFVANE